MPSFAVVALRDKSRLEAKIASTIAEADRLLLTPDVWLVSYAGTTTQLSEALAVTDGTSGPAVILAIGNYYGRANPDVWEWLKLHFDAGA